MKDRRLSRRLVRVVETLGNNPNGSIPEASGDWAGAIGAYRFFANEKVTAEAILKPHREETIRRVREEKVVLLVQDTTEVDLSRPEQKVAGAGPLDHSGRRGMLLHSLLAFTPEGLCLGTVWSKQWSRPPERAKARRSRPLEQKESVRWVEGIEQVRAVGQEAPGVQCIGVADSEADMAALFTAANGAEDRKEVKWIVRACQDRALESPEESRYLWAALEQAPVLYQEKIAVRGRRGPLVARDQRARRQAKSDRLSEVAVRARLVHVRVGRQSVPLHAVLVREVTPPAGEAAVEWLLLTTLPITTESEVRRIVQYYRQRFLIEVYFRTLKSGCRIEARRFEYLERLSACLAVFQIVGWRILQIVHQSRLKPEQSCETIFLPNEWRSVWVFTERRRSAARSPKPIPKQPPSLLEITLRVAQLGGYLRRGPSSTPPGVETLWRGLTRLHDLAAAWSAFRPPTCV